jgi:hypothetical protein
MLQGGNYFLQANLDFKQYYDRFADPDVHAVERMGLRPLACWVFVSNPARA